MRVFPVGLAGAAVVTASALLLRYVWARRTDGATELTLQLREAAEATLVDRLRARGI